MHEQVQSAAYFIEYFSIEETKSRSKISPLINIHAGESHGNIIRAVHTKTQEHSQDLR